MEFRQVEGILKNKGAGKGTSRTIADTAWGEGWGDGAPDLPHTD